MFLQAKLKPNVDMRSYYNQKHPSLTVNFDFTHICICLGCFRIVLLLYNCSKPVKLIFICKTEEVVSSSMAVMQLNIF